MSGRTRRALPRRGTDCEPSLGAAVGGVCGPETFTSCFGRPFAAVALRLHDARMGWNLRAEVLVSPDRAPTYREGRRSVSCARRHTMTGPADRPPQAPLLADARVWQVADGVLFSVLSSLVLWSIIITSLYQALT